MNNYIENTGKENDIIEAIIKDAIKQSLASFGIDGFKFTDEEIRELENYFLANEKLRLLVKKGWQNGEG